MKSKKHMTSCRTHTHSHFITIWIMAKSKIVKPKLALVQTRVKARESHRTICPVAACSWSWCYIHESRRRFIHAHNESCYSEGPQDNKEGQKNNLTLTVILYPDMNSILSSESACTLSARQLHNLAQVEVAAHTPKTSTWYSFDHATTRRCGAWT